MLNKISAFFKNLIENLFGSNKNPESKQTSPSDPATPDPAPVNEDLPKSTKDSPQDAPEIDEETTKTIIVSDESESVPLEPGDAPADIEVTTDEPDSTIPQAEIDPIPETEPDVSETPMEDSESEPVAPTSHKARYMWCLDNGHGKFTAGKRSPIFEDGTQFFEYEFNRDIVKRIISQLDELGVKYFNVVPEVDIDNFLEGRVARANQHESTLPKIFLSIHANAFGMSGWESPSGIETWFYHTSRSGRALASVFQKQLIKTLNWKNRNLKSYPGPNQFYVLKKTKMPAVLTENGFYTNKEECRLLLRDDIRQKIADAHVNAIMEIEANGI